MNIFKRKKYGWFGDFKNWTEASNASSGYDSENILKKVLVATLKVKNKEATFERDSVLFYEDEFVWPILSPILLMESTSSRSLHVMDFGGSLGSFYFQHLNKIKDKQIVWNVVEQPNFVNCGREQLQDERLRFFNSIQEFSQNSPADIALFASVLPYIENPFEELKKVLDQNFRLLIFDRIPFLTEGKTHRITVQRVNPVIYDASYPAWFFNKEKFLNAIPSKYSLIYQGGSIIPSQIPASFETLIFLLKA